MFKRYALLLFLSLTEWSGFLANDLFADADLTRKFPLAVDPPLDRGVL